MPKGTGNQLMAALQIGARRATAMPGACTRSAPGETLAAIGKRYNVTPANIVAANHLQSPEAQEGDRLLIPAAARAEAPRGPQRPRTTAGRIGHAAAVRRHGPATSQDGGSAARAQGSGDRRARTAAQLIRTFFPQILGIAVFRYCLVVKKGYSMGDCALTTGGLLNV